MPASNPFEDLLEQLRKLLEFVEQKMHVPAEEMTIPQDIDKRLRRLQKRVEAFKKISEEVVSLSGVSSEEIKMRLRGVSKEVPPEGKELIDMGNELKAQAMVLKDKFDAKMKYAKQEYTSAQPDEPEDSKRDLTDKEKAKKRRGKFKRFGSDDKWKPL